MDRWVGKVAVITGASSGIGADLSLRLANLGVVVIGFARRKQLIDELAKKVTGSGAIHARQADLSKYEDIKEAFEWVENNFGEIHILINNAAVLHEGNITALGDKLITDDKVSSIIDVNFRGLVLSTRLAVENMKKNNVDGHIVNINSVVGHFIPKYPYSYVYTATKHAVTSFTSSLIIELARYESKIKVTSLSPGVVYTEMVADLLREDEPRVETSDVTDALIYVLSTPPNVNIYELGIKAVGEGQV